VSNLNIKLNVLLKLKVIECLQDFDLKKLTFCFKSDSEE